MPGGPYHLLGKGERLTGPVEVARGPGDPKPPYTFAQAKERLEPKIISTSRSLSALPRSACPNDESIAVVTLHPQYLAKSYYPSALLNTLGLTTVGSRPAVITPEAWGKKGEPVESVTSELFVSGKRERFLALADSISKFTDSGAYSDLIKIENFSYVSPTDRIKGIRRGQISTLIEVVLHSGSKKIILDSFVSYMKELGILVDTEKRIEAGDLAFVAVRIPLEKIEEVAKFSFLRVARDMPRLRKFQPECDSPLTLQGFPISMPQIQGPLDPEIRVAILDAGLTELDFLSPWVQRKTLRSDTGDEDPQGIVHGLAVTSSLLFGPIHRGKPLETPYAKIDHYRVVDTNTGKGEDDNATDLYDVLKRIVRVLETKHYNFVNISLGPDKPVDDDDVSAWTAILDPFFANGDVLATISVGNTGESDELLRYDKIQPPSDCVNALSVGACDSIGSPWARATYSSTGPGRSPGIVKPEIVAFGGSDSEPFWVLDGDNPGSTLPIRGTSFSTPAALRMALGVRAMLGPELKALTLKALLIHLCESGPHGLAEVGWGRLNMDLEKLITSDKKTVHVIYQGFLEPKKYLRAIIPVPSQPAKGMIRISATFCIATSTDPAHPVAYTKSGVEIFFRPNAENIKKQEGKDTFKLHQETESFFQSHSHLTEAEARRDAHKWETTLKGSKRKYANKLLKPSFDIHYTPRESGADARSPDKIPYALMITVHGEKMEDLYDRVSVEFQSILEPLRPRHRLQASNQVEPTDF